MQKIFLSLVLISGGIAGCTSNENSFDATGVFEADEIMVSAEIPGRITEMKLEEGDKLEAGMVVAVIDAGNIDLQKEQVQASIKALQQKTADVAPQIQLLKEQLRVQETQMQNLLKEKERFTRLVAADAATPKQLDDIEAQIEVLNGQMKVTISQMKVQESNIATQNRSILSEKEPLSKRADVLMDQIKRSNVTNPVNGTVLSKYAYAGEMIGAGKALYKIADLHSLYLRAYFTGDQISGIKLGDTIDVYVDSSKTGYKKYAGKIIRISDKAEFTPKTIQTKDERANQVYAVKIQVVNDGFLKIGQYGEVKF